MRPIYENRPRKKYEKGPTKETCIREKTPIDCLWVFFAEARVLLAVFRCARGVK